VERRRGGASRAPSTHHTRTQATRASVRAKGPFSPTKSPTAASANDSLSDQPKANRRNASREMTSDVATHPRAKTTAVRRGKYSQLKSPTTASTAAMKRRRPRGDSIHKEVKVKFAQTFLLLSIACISWILFLLFTLPFGALIGLTLMVSSLGACVLVLASLLKTRYQMELEAHPLGLIRHLPADFRRHLTEKTLHEVLKPSTSMDSLVTLSISRKGSRESLATIESQGESKTVQGKRLRYS